MIARVKPIKVAVHVLESLGQMRFHLTSVTSTSKQSLSSRARETARKLLICSVFGKRLTVLTDELVPLVPVR
jgi:hypothetical protein